MGHSNVQNVNATPFTQNVVTSNYSYLIYVPHCKGIM